VAPEEGEEPVAAVRMRINVPKTGKRPVIIVLDGATLYRRT
jgi:hypothetical protein